MRDWRLRGINHGGVQNVKVAERLGLLKRRGSGFFIGAAPINFAVEIVPRGRRSCSVKYELDHESRTRLLRLGARASLGSFLAAARRLIRGIIYKRQR